MGVVCKQPTTPFGKSNILTSKCANVGSSAKIYIIFEKKKEDYFIEIDYVLNTNNGSAFKITHTQM